MKVKEVFQYIPHMTGVSSYKLNRALENAELIGYCSLQVHDVKQTDTIANPHRSKEMRFQDFAIIVRLDGKLRAFVKGHSEFVGSEHSVLQVLDYIQQAQFKRMIPNRSKLLREIMVEAI